MTFPGPEFFHTANWTISEVEILLARIIISSAGLIAIYIFPAEKEGAAVLIATPRTKAGNVV
jgi:hypothetical protein